MNAGRIVFAQIKDYLPLRRFDTIVQRYNGNYKVSRFSCLDQFLCMAFAQLTYRESLRDIEACLRAVPNKLYHMGIRSTVSRSTLADANEDTAQCGDSREDRSRRIHRGENLFRELAWVFRHRKSVSANR